MKRSFNRAYATASARDMAEASSSCADPSDVKLISDTILLVSVFVMALAVRVSMITIVLSIILVLLVADRPPARLKTQALIA